MDPRQLELDLGVEKTEKKVVDSCLVVDLQTVRKLKQDLQKEELFRAIISSVDHITPPNRQYK